jgi:hypothetical protein
MVIGLHAIGKFQLNYIYLFQIIPDFVSVGAWTGACLIIIFLLIGFLNFRLFLIRWQVKKAKIASLLNSSENNTCFDSNGKIVYRKTSNRRPGPSIFRPQNFGNFYLGPPLCDPFKRGPSNREGLLLEVLRYWKFRKNSL